MRGVSGVKAGPTIATAIATAVTIEIEIEIGTAVDADRPSRAPSASARP